MLRASRLGIPNERKQNDLTPFSPFLRFSEPDTIFSEPSAGRCSIPSCSRRVFRKPTSAARLSAASSQSTSLTMRTTKSTMLSAGHLSFRRGRGAPARFPFYPFRLGLFGAQPFVCPRRRSELNLGASSTDQSTLTSTVYQHPRRDSSITGSDLRSVRSKLGVS